MEQSKRQKRLWTVLLGAGLLVAAAVLVLVWQMRDTFQEGPFEIRRNPQTQAVEYCGVRGTVSEDQLTLPLDCYTFTPPDEWVQVEDAMEHAHQYSTGYIDSYRTQAGDDMLFVQLPATQQVLGSENQGPLTDLSAIQEVRFGEEQVIYYQQEVNTEYHPSGVETAVYWVHGQNLLNLICYRDKDVEQMLELIQQVDYNALRRPAGQQR